MRSPVGSRPRHGVIDIQAEGFFNLPRPTIYRYTLCIQCISYRKGSSSCLLNGQCDAMRLLQTAPFWPDCIWMHIRLIRDPEWMCGLGLIHGTKKALTWVTFKRVIIIHLRTCDTKNQSTPISIIWSTRNIPSRGLGNPGMCTYINVGNPVARRRNKYVNL